ncbi:MAG: hypothetical protein ACREN2_06105 [Candidatus Dormibacteria bacterium]
MTQRITTDRRVPSFPEDVHMLVATRSFEYDDPYTGRQDVKAGITHVHPTHWLATEYPDAFVKSDRPAQILDSVPIDPRES